MWQAIFKLTKKGFINNLHLISKAEINTFYGQGVKILSLLRWRQLLVFLVS